MLKLLTNDKSKVKQQINDQILDGIVASNSNLIDDIILAMLHDGVLECLNDGFVDKRKHNTTVPFNMILAMAIAAKMRTHTSLTDIPYAIRNHHVLAELGCAMMNTTPEKGWFNEGTLRHLIGKYTSQEFFDYYNTVVQEHIFKKFNIHPDIHILDCTKIAVNPDNPNFENATWAVDRKGNKMFGYKLASLRGLYEDTGVIEEVCFGTAETHDLELSREMLKTTSVFHEGDSLLMDRGFISRDMINFLKNERKIDVYIPARKSMNVYTLGVALSEEADDWNPHPTRKDQLVHFVSNLGDYWESDDKENDVPINGCVAWTQEDQNYAVFLTTDMSKSAEEIIMMYEMRTEIEEDFRQLKDFRKLEDFKSTKYDVISFHLMSILLGYLFYQLFLNTDDGCKYVGKCLPVILKSYKEEFLKYLVIYSGKYFCTMTMREFLEYRDSCSEVIKEFILEYFD